jgi:hypothetical protein
MIYVNRLPQFGGYGSLRRQPWNQSIGSAFSRGSQTAPGTSLRPARVRWKFTHVAEKRAVDLARTRFAQLKQVKLVDAAADYHKPELLPKRKRVSAAIWNKTAHTN